MSIKDLPSAARPREKLLALGAASLADAELLALLLRTGIRGLGVLQLAEAVLQRFGGFAGLLHADVRDLAKVKGLGPAKRAELAAVIEMAKRSMSQRLSDLPVFASPLELKQYVQLQLSAHQREVFAVLYLDASFRLLAMEEMFLGSLAHTSVHPREIVRRAMACNAGAVILAHNHPSGVAEASPSDLAVTKSIISALALVGVKVLDHMIVGQGSVLSFNERGLL